MCNIIQEMLQETQHSIFRLGIFLAAYLAVFAGHRGTAVQAVFLFTLGSVRQVENFVKNKAIGYILIALSIVYKAGYAFTGDLSFTFASNL